MDSGSNITVIQLNAELNRCIGLCENAGSILSQGSEDFDIQAAIRKDDIPYLALSLAIGGLSKKIIRDLRLKKDDELADMNPLHNEEHSDRLGSPYYVSRPEIICNPVPFDAITTDDIFKSLEKKDKRRPGFSGSNHRYKALGHDPLAGLVFGTANIMTGTITRNDFRSWHVNTKGHERFAKDGNTYIADLDTICEPASTPMIFQSIYNRIKQEGKDGWMTLGTALAKEIIHLSTDLCSLESLPFPGISLISDDLAHKLSLYGFNTGTLIEGPILMKISNFIVSFLHRLSMKPGENEEIFRLRTQKILMYSNIFVTYGDIAITFYEAVCGDRKALRKFDLGGYLLSLGQVTEISREISRMRAEYMVNEYIRQISSEQ